MGKSQLVNPTFSNKVSNWLVETNCSPDIPFLNEWDNHHVFIYNDHRHGYRRSIRLQDAQLCGYGLTQKPNYTMGIFRNKYPYPVVLETEDTTLQGRIFGEVYLVKTEDLIALDFMESNTSTWHRKRVPITMIGPHRPQAVMCYMYIGNPAVWDSKIGTQAWVFKQPRQNNKDLPKNYQFLIGDQTDKAFIINPAPPNLESK